MLYSYSKPGGCLLIAGAGCWLVTLRAYFLLFPELLFCRVSSFLLLSMKFLPGLFLRFLTALQYRFCFCFGDSRLRGDLSQDRDSFSVLLAVECFFS